MRLPEAILSISFFFRTFAVVKKIENHFNIKKF